MEEDEASDGGFPLVLREEDDKHLICSDERLLSSISARAILSTENDGRSYMTLPRLKQEQDGIAFFDVDTLPYRTLAIVFCHDESGAELEIKFLNADKNAQMNNVDSMPSRVEPNTECTQHSEEKMQEGKEDLDEYEEDGFLVPDDSEGSEKGTDDEDEDDLCCLCQDGGELLVCDGGDHIDGCGRNFHIQCIRRNQIPPGDWICDQCAGESGISCGIEGHEFPSTDSEVDEEFIDSSEAPETSGRLKRNHSVLEDSSEDEAFNPDNRDIDDSFEFQPPKKGNRKQRMIIDSDEE
uniref:PHD-type domain-containing protein n=2 Tax=Pseudictyota dubia TaxID=2749911 RepID=A0A7R9Z885_9STRA